MSFRPQRSGVEESTTLEEEPTQDKTSNLGRFLDSHSFARNDMSVGGSALSTRVVFAAFPERHIGRSLRFRWWLLPFIHTGYIRNVAGGRLLPIALPQRKSPTGRFGKPLPWGCWLFGADAAGIDLGDFRLFVQEDQVGVFAGGDGAFGFPQAHFPGGVFRQGGENFFQG